MELRAGLFQCPARCMDWREDGSCEAKAAIYADFTDIAVAAPIIFSICINLAAHLPCRTPIPNGYAHFG